VTLSVFVEVSPVAQVTGLRWGDYVGSPDHPSPVITWSSDHKQTVVKLAALSTGEVFGLDPFSTLLVRETGSSVSIVNDMLSQLSCHQQEHVLSLVVRLLTTAAVC